MFVSSLWPSVASPLPATTQKHKAPLHVKRSANLEPNALDQPKVSALIPILLVNIEDGNVIKLNDLRLCLRMLNDSIGICPSLNLGCKRLGIIGILIPATTIGVIEGKGIINTIMIVMVNVDSHGESSFQGSWR